MVLDPVSPSPKFCVLPADGLLTPTMCIRSTYMTDLQWTWVSKPRISGSLPKARPANHSGPRIRLGCLHQFEVFMETSNLKERNNFISIPIV
ncbi:hypothetical protein AVEN_189192-1 [Araneus ventricosus]|uniref:Uncharacterized protein n=1 Tax=Araneus ventricosus TaxID=182803 RepID=A0A4Y2KHA6_ARAVE|nr:hypothetical protein AVEN_189192-1 [Araneus ventricosus]